VRLALMGERAALKGDAAAAAGSWEGPVEALAEASLDGAALVVDALFGAGLARPIDGLAHDVIAGLAARRLPVIAVDVPSGIDGASGEVRGIAPSCVLTVTFFRKKPGHLLFPARGLCGETILADIGIPASTIETIAPRTFENAPALWLDTFPWPRLDGHKYSRGHALVGGGAAMTGAARLAARAAARAGAGLVTVAAPQAVAPIYAASLTGVIVQPVGGSADFAALLADKRRNAILLGPGLGTGSATGELVRAALATGRAVVLDADVFAAFSGRAGELAAAIAGPTLLTPHEGEFARLFGAAGDKLARARRAAGESATTVLLKGADTVVAAADGWAAINANAPAELATAGSGDVLAGIVVGLLAQGMEPFAAAAAGVWMHGDAACRIGPALISEDLVEELAPVLRELGRRQLAEPPIGSWR